MLGPDLFVGCVAMIGGCIFIFGAVQNDDLFFRFWVARFVESRWSRGVARMCYVVLGAFLILLGGAIAAGWNLTLVGESAAQDVRHSTTGEWRGLPVG